MDYYKDGINLLKEEKLEGPSPHSLEHSQYLGVSKSVTTQVFQT